MHEFDTFEKKKIGFLNDNIQLPIKRIKSVFLNSHEILKFDRILLYTLKKTSQQWKQEQREKKY